MNRAEPAESRQLIYDWNAVHENLAPPRERVQLNDETLRDGLQSPSVRTPSIAEKLELLHLMDDIGIDTLNVGFPAAGPLSVEHITALAREIRDCHLKIAANVACRTLVADFEPLVRICDEVGMPIEATGFIGSSPIRRYVEEWNLPTMLKNIEDSITFVVKHGLKMMFVTEDTTRAEPDILRQLYTCAIHSGATRICFCDTVGHATPSGVASLITFGNEIVQATGADVGIDFHGHNDRGFGTLNTLSAISAGATRVHATALGIGERCGNASMDQLLVNMKLMGWIDNDLTRLKEYVQVAARATDTPIPVNYPAFGVDAFRTQSGVHAAAVVKAFRRGEDWLANRVYSAVPADMFGLKQSIEIGPMSGEHNVRYWLVQHNITETDALVMAIMDEARKARGVLTEAQIQAIVRSKSS